ncbi:SAM-dependent methyltransferase [Acidocella aquatica]|uniref:SAM-dependent methyltransferase n=1 Tax=Acidocella aquatica TaxID=1922313 RepID=A0ABQ6A252_9PROT|nr:class I SAM-dependent methyltransferase [Acidocella aquatica]GLR65717.1 SAM-dependent methyltransferase [Acidocella aquatica]
MTLEQTVARHYAHGSLERDIFDALAATGKNLSHLVPADLSPIDEFHIGGRQATVDFAAELGFKPGMLLLDIGAGLGGASRYFAHEQRCRVTGIDITEDYVRAAKTLARHVGLESEVAYLHGSALDLPFESGSFDGAYMLHAGMNIREKSRLFEQVRRVLKPGGLFGIYDVMREDISAELNFPLPWAATPEASFVETTATYRHLLEGAGFVVRKERNRRAFAIAFFQQMRARMAQSEGPPRLGLHQLMGGTAPQKIANMIDNLERNLIAPVELISAAV